MSHEQVCSWLGLPPGSWPPNHYVLLGLPAGEADVQKIEERVHERLLKLRHYQLNHPDQATEAMNRVAQAFACLTDPEAKKAYDRQLLSPQAEPLPDTPTPVPEPLVISPDEPDPLAWLFGPWAQGDAAGDEAPAEAQAVPREFSATTLKAVDWAKEPPPPRVPVGATPSAGTPVAGNGAPANASAPEAAAPEEQSRLHEALSAAARFSRLARRGLGTQRAVYYRIAHTRELLWHWKQVGKYLGKPTRRLTRLSEATELSRHLAGILEALPNFPPLLGKAGQPGYLVIVLARQPLIVPTFRSLLPPQREILAQHWRDGHTLLLQHRRFLRDELHQLRHKSAPGRWLRAVYATVADQPEALLLLLALLALNLALWSQLGH